MNKIYFVYFKIHQASGYSNCCSDNNKNIRKSWKSYQSEMMIFFMMNQMWRKNEIFIFKINNSNTHQILNLDTQLDRKNLIEKKFTEKELIFGWAFHIELHKDE